MNFNNSDVQTFITSVQAIKSQLFEIGIDLPQDLVAHIVLNKLASTLTKFCQKLTHSGKPLTSNLGLDHLKLYSNNQLAIAN
jgi:hypothetical protein